MESSLIVTKDNQLIQAGYQLTLSEQRVLLMCIAKLDSRTRLPDDYEFTLSVDELHKEMGVTRENAYRDLRNAVNNLYKRTIYIDPDEPDSELRWVYKKAFFKSEGLVTIYFSPDILPFLTELKERFTTYKLKDVRHFSCSYSLRFYELMIQWKSKTEIKISVEQIRKILMLGSKYPRVIDLKRNVILPAIHDINTFSNMKVEFDQAKSGREVTHFIFRYTISGEIETPKKQALTDEYVQKHARPGETWAQARARLKRDA